MGVDMKGFEAEAAEIWKQLNEMAESKPLEYQAFVDEQLNSANEVKETKASPCFRPTPGFSICTTTTGGDGIKVRVDGGGKSLFLNFCHHVAVEAPTDGHGRPCEDHNLLHVGGLQIPLVVGPARSIEKAHALVVDVIVNPNVIRCCEFSTVFKAQVVDLAYEWVPRESGITFVKRWKECDEKYSHGIGDDGDAPVLFYVDGPGPTVQAPANSSNPTSVDDKELMKSLLRERALEKQKTPEIDMNVTKADKGLSEPKKPAIVELGTEAVTTQRSPAIQNSSSAKKSTSIPRNADTTKVAEISDIINIKKGIVNSPEADPSPAESVPKPAGKTKKGPAIKKGFLMGTGAGKLYPKGSKEGERDDGSGATGGSFARIMDKCKVVNVPPGGLEAAAQPQLNGSSLPQPPQAVDAGKPSAQVRSKETLPTSSPSEQRASSRIHGGKTAKAPSRNEVAEMERLLSMVDSEFGAEMERDEWAKKLQGEEFCNQFSQLAKVLGGEAGMDEALSTMMKDMAGAQLGEEPPFSSPPAAPFMQAASNDSASYACAESKSRDGEAVVSAGESVSAFEEVSVRLSAGRKTAVREICEADSTPSALVLEIAGLEPSFKASSADLQISQGQLIVHLPGKSEDHDVVHLNAYSSLDCTRCKASFSKKRGTLTITAGYTEQS
jgi:hypothetical protein